MAGKKQLGQILLDAGLIDEFQLKSALGYQKQWGGRLGKVLVENRFVTEDALVDAIHRQIGVPKVNLASTRIAEQVLGLIPENLCEKHNLLPIGAEGEAGKPTETIVVAMADPTDLSAQDEVRFLTGKKLKVVLASEGAILRAIRRYYHGEDVPVEEPAFQRTDPARIQFGGQELDADEMALVQGTLEALPGEGRSSAGDEAKESAGSLLDDDPFAELDSLAKGDESPVAQPPVNPVPSPVPSRPGPPQPVQAEVQSTEMSGTPPVEEDLPEVEIVEELEPEPEAPAEPQPRRPQPACNPPPPPAVELEGFALDDEFEVDLDDVSGEEVTPPRQQPVVHPQKARSGPELKPASEPPVSSKPPPIREVPPGPEPPAPAVPTDDETPAVEPATPVPATSQPAVAEAAPDSQEEAEEPGGAEADGLLELAHDVLDSVEKPEEPPAATGDSGEAAAGLEGKQSSAMEALLSRVGIKTSTDPSRPAKPAAKHVATGEAGSRPEAGTEATPAGQEQPDVSGTPFLPNGMEAGDVGMVARGDEKFLEEALVDEVQRLLDGIEAREISGEPPQVAKAHNLIAAMIRLLLKKEVFTDEELLDELKRK